MNSPDKRYAIVVNPLAGKLTIDQKRAILEKPAKILKAEVYGLDTSSPSEFQSCAREIASNYEILVVTGGDGTFSDIINAIDTTHTTIAYLPLGSGNAMQYALKYEGALADIALRIRAGAIKEYDLINCDDKRRAFMVSIGIEGIIIQLRSSYHAEGERGFKSYLKSTFNAFLKEYKGIKATITIDDDTFEVPDLLNISVVKQPYYGFGMKMVPQARFDDHQLHILYIDSSPMKSFIGGVTAFTIGNQIGEYRTGRQLTVQLEQLSVLQIDGNEAWESDTFKFTVLPKALKIKC